MVYAAAVTESAALHFAKESVVRRDLGCRGLLEHVLKAAEDEHGTALLPCNLLVADHQFLGHEARSLNLSDVFSHSLIEVFDLETYSWRLKGIRSRFLA